MMVSQWLADGVILMCRGDSVEAVDAGMLAGGAPCVLSHGKSAQEPAPTQARVGPCEKQGAFTKDPCPFIRRNTAFASGRQSRRVPTA